MCSLKNGRRAQVKFYPTKRWGCGKSFSRTERGHKRCSDSFNAGKVLAILKVGAQKVPI